LCDDDNARGPEYTFVQSVALLRNCSDRSWCHALGLDTRQRERWIVGLHRAYRFVCIGIEWLVESVDSGDAMPLKHT
jgi:hypothetical protein